MRVAIAMCFLAGCSFVGVRGPSDRMGVLPDDESKLSCTRSTMLPTLDALGGAAGLVVAAGGSILQYTSEDGKPEHFLQYYAGPIALVSIVYLVSASYGNNRITWCDDAHERMAETRDVVKPVPQIDLPPTPKPPTVEPKPEPTVETPPEPTPETKPEPKPKAKPKRKPKPKPKAQPKPKPKGEPVEMEPDPIR
jgi:cell division septation protein DedD